MKWISVKERLPEDNERILFYWPEGNYKMPCFVFGFFDGTDFLSEDFKLLVRQHEASHWLRIPPLEPDQEPKECEKPCELCAARHKSNHIKVKI